MPVAYRARLHLGFAFGLCFPQSFENRDSLFRTLKDSSDQLQLVANNFRLLTSR